MCSYKQPMDRALLWPNRLAAYASRLLTLLGTHFRQKDVNILGRNEGRGLVSVGAEAEALVLAWQAHGLGGE